VSGDGPARTAAESTTEVRDGSTLGASLASQGEPSARDADGATLRIPRR